jgi:photosystem II stability/assembly factor-like uncharacterized protein
MRRGRAWVGVCLAAAALLACGGGGNDSAPPTALPENLAITGPGTAEAATAVAFGSSAGSLSGLKYQWDFGDGGSSIEAAPTHRFSRAGDFDVKLKVSNDAGASREVRKTISVTSLANVRGLQCSGPDSSGWCWQSPRPTGSLVHTVFFVDATTGWRAGGAGDIFKTTDGGASWKRQDSGVTTSIDYLAFLDARLGWAIDGQGRVLRTADGGDTWAVSERSITGTPFSFTRYQISSPDGQTVYVHGTDAAVSHDAGATWQPGGRDRFVDSGNVVWRVAEGGGLQRSINGGKNFVNVLPVPAGDSISAPYFQDALRATILLASGDRYTSVDGGVSWVRTRDTFYRGLSILLISADGRVLVGRAGAGHSKDPYRYWRSTDAGQTWADMPAPDAATDAAMSYWQVDGDSGLLMAQGGSAAWLSRDGLSWDRLGGDFWARSTIRWSTDSRMRRMKEGLLIAYTSDSSDYLSADGGKTWRNVVPPDLSHRPAALYNSSASALGFSDAKNGFMIDVDGKARISSDGGASWQATGQTFQLPQRLQIVGGQAGWMIDTDGYLLKTVDGGRTWARNDGQTWSGQPNGPDVRYTHFGFQNPSLGWYRRIYPHGDYRFTQYAVTRDGGGTWEPVSFPLPHDVSFMHLGVQQWVAVSTSRHVLISRDAGKSWDVTGPFEGLYRPVTSDDDTLWWIRDQGKLAKLEVRSGVQSIIDLPLGSDERAVVVKLVNAKVGWIVGVGGLVLRTDDGGKTWQRQKSGADKLLNGIVATDANTAWLTAYDGSVLATGTGGR